MSLPVSAIQPVRAESNAREVDFVRDFFDGMAAAQRSSQIYLNDMRAGQEMALAQDKFGHLQEMDYMKFAQKERDAAWDRETDMLKESRLRADHNLKVEAAQQERSFNDWIANGGYQQSAYGGGTAGNSKGGLDENGLPTWGGLDIDGLNDYRVSPGSFSKSGRGQGQAGTLVVGGSVFSFVSGGKGRGKAPSGVYQISNARRRSDKGGMMKGGFGFSFDMLNPDGTDGVPDPRFPDKDRTLLRMHPDGGSCGTQGCFGIQGDADTQRKFYEKGKDFIDANGGKGYLALAPNGQSQMFATKNEADAFMKGGGYSAGTPNDQRKPSNGLFPESGPIAEGPVDFSDSPQEDPNPYGFTPGFLNLRQAEAAAKARGRNAVAAWEAVWAKENARPENIAALERESVQTQKDSLRGLNRNDLKPNFRSLYDRLNNEGVSIAEEAFKLMENFDESIFLDIAQDSPYNQFDRNDSLRGQGLSEAEAALLKSEQRKLDALKGQIESGEASPSAIAAVEESQAVVGALTRRRDEALRVQRQSRIQSPSADSGFVDPPSVTPDGLPILDVIPSDQVSPREPAAEPAPVGPPLTGGAFVQGVID